jgi:hypothetical protein
MSVFAEHVAGALVAQAATTLLVRTHITPTTSLERWYRELGFSAVAVDVLSLAVGTYAGARLAGPRASLAAAAAAAVAVQVVHDFAFGAVLTRSTASSRGTLPLFRAYVAEKGLAIVRDDALMMVGAVVATRLLRDRLRDDDAAAVAATAAYVNLILALGM